MEKAMHTPGPWSTEYDLPHNRMPRVHGTDHSLICEVGNCGTTQDQWEANSRLIAASPDMFALLREIVAPVSEIDDGHMKHLIQQRAPLSISMGADFFIRARAIIAKIEGAE